MNQVQDLILGNILDAMALGQSRNNAALGKPLNKSAFGDLFKQATAENKSDKLTDIRKKDSMDQRVTSWNKSKNDTQPKDTGKIKNGAPVKSKDESQDKTSNETDTSLIAKAFMPVIEMKEAADVTTPISGLDDLLLRDIQFSEKAVAFEISDIIKNMDSTVQSQNQQFVGALEEALSQTQMQETAPQAPAITSEQTAGMPETIALQEPAEIFSKVKEIRVAKSFEDANKLVAEADIAPDENEESVNKTSPDSEPETDVSNDGQKSGLKELTSKKTENADDSFQTTIHKMPQRVEQSAGTVTVADHMVNLPDEVKSAAMSNIAERISSMMQQGKQEVSIQMTPDFLGNLSIKLSMGREGLVAKLHTESLEAKNLINAQITQLVESLKDKGVKIVQMDVIHQEMSQDPKQDGHGNMYQYKAPRKMPAIGGVSGRMDMEMAHVSVYDFSTDEQMLTGLNNSMEFTA